MIFILDARLPHLDTFGYFQRVMTLINVSEEVLSAYPKRWDSEIGKHFKHICRIRDGVLKFTDETLDRYAEVLSKLPSENNVL